MIVASNELVSTTGALLRFQRALLADDLFSRPATTRLFTERANRLRNMIPIRYGLGTMIFRVTTSSHGCDQTAPVAPWHAMSLLVRHGDR